MDVQSEVSFHRCLLSWGAYVVATQEFPTSSGGTIPTSSAAPSTPYPDDAYPLAGEDYHSAGRVDGALLEKLVPGLAADFYLCGPRGFMAAIQAQLEARGVPPERIRTESFGPVFLIR